MGGAQVDLAIVGGGIVGLSIAYEASLRGRSVILLEKNARFGGEQSTHNSMVLHAGIYYPEGSLKTRLCVDGRAEMVRRCDAWGVPHRVCGKLIVARDVSEEPELERLLTLSHANGARTSIVYKDEIRRIEPQVEGTAALLSPDSGVVDAGAYVQALAAHAEEAGATLLHSAPVIGVVPRREAVEVTTSTRGAVAASCAVNAAGLYADEVARLAGNEAYRIHPCRGEYAAVVSRRAGLVNNLVYPVPWSTISLGVHFTRTVDGGLWIGPTARYVGKKDDYESGRLPLQEFFERGRPLVPGLRFDDLRFGPAGIRAKRVPEGAPPADYLIEADPKNGRLIHLIGIESPGLTASPAIGRFVSKMVDGVL